MTQRDPNAKRASTQPFNDPVFYRDTQAVSKGRRAFKDGQPRQDCPYPQNTRSRTDWLAGWWAENQRADENFADVPQQTHHRNIGLKTAMGYAVIK